MLNIKYSNIAEITRYNVRVDKFIYGGFRKLISPANQCRIQKWRAVTSLI